MTGRLSDVERLSVQLGNVTAASMDLRAHRGNPDLRDLVRGLRDVRERAYALLPWVSPSDAMWAAHRIEIRLGLRPFGHIYQAGQRFDQHTQQGDVVTLIEWLRATS